jgi:tRNA pseudouridine13 synthase
MTVKQSPGDFRVEELTDRTPRPAGGFALYRLEKAGWTTPDAVGGVCHRWRIDRRLVSFGGLKDRHAETVQYFTITDGPERDLAFDHVSLTYLGRTDSPFTSADVRANRFAITLRNLSAAEAERIAAEADGVARVGLPNYFDDQRFGSVSPDGEFVGRLLVMGEFEAALKLALIAPYEHDRSGPKRAKAHLRKHWGDWRKCRAVLPRELIPCLLRNPPDYRTAVTRLNPELQGLHLAAYQSDLWNRTLARWLRDAFPAELLGSIRTKRGEMPVPLEANDAWPGLLIPLPSARLSPVPGAAWWPALDAVLAEEGLSLDELRVSGVRKPFFSKGERPARVVPAGLTADSGDDETHPGRSKLFMRFDLPRGAYATMLVKRLAVSRSAPKTTRRG